VDGTDILAKKIFNGKTFAVSKNPRKSQKFFPLNDLTYTVYVEIPIITNEWKSIHPSMSNVTITLYGVCSLTTLKHVD